MPNPFAPFPRPDIVVALLELQKEFFGLTGRFDKERISHDKLRSIGSSNNVDIETVPSPHKERSKYTRMQVDTSEGHRKFVTPAHPQPSYAVPTKQRRRCFL